MLNKKQQIENPNSCLNKARDDELIFVLLARDEAAQLAVAAWIEARIKSGKNKPGDAKIQSAWDWIAAVRKGAQQQ